MKKKAKRNQRAIDYRRRLVGKPGGSLTPLGAATVGWYDGFSAGYRAAKRDARTASKRGGKTCSQCGDPVGGKACGPTHAAMAAELKEKGVKP